MFPDHHIPFAADRMLRTDRRPLPKANEIRLRVRRAGSRREV
jgi:hypothetical protein